MSDGRVIRRVRLELPLEIPSPHSEHLAALPYEAWLRAHVEEVMGLKGPRGDTLLSGVISSKSATSNIFVTDFHFSCGEDMEFYNCTYRDAMRGRVIEAYPMAAQVGSPFLYRIAISTEVSHDEFDALGLLQEPVLLAKSGHVDG